MSCEVVLPSGRIRVHSLQDLMGLIQELGNPGELILPLPVYRIIWDRSQVTQRNADDNGEFVWFCNVKIRPPKPISRVVDLSNVEFE